MMMHRSNPNPPSSFDDQDEDQRVGLQRLSPLTPFSPSSKLVYFCLADCNGFHWYPLRVSSDVEVKRVGLQLVMEIAHPVPDPFIYSESPPPSISSHSLLPRPPSSSRIAYICLTDIDESYWYAFQVSEDVDHNNQQLPHNNPRLPFHQDDYERYDFGSDQFLKPILTAKLLTLSGASWVIHNSSLYQFVRQWRNDKKGNQLVRIDLGNNPIAKKLDIFPQLPHALGPRIHTLVLDDKFYCLGGLEPPPSPWAMAFDPSLNQWESLPNPAPFPPFPIMIKRIFSAAIHVPKPCIVVGWPEDRVLRRYYVNTKNWVSEEFEIPKTRFFGPDDLMGPALAVDRMLYWYSARDTTACLIGYDLMRKTWFMGKFNVHDYGRSYIPEHTGPPPPPSLAHLGSDKFCLFWFSVVKCHPNPTTITEEDSLTKDEDEDEDEEYVEEVEEESLRIHCMKLRVTNGSRRLRSGIFPLEICSISCQSYLVAENATYFCDGLVV
ncbi:uncharacterized protein LOC114269869 [Camellia sinensis]|uniref:uncharacterized protein LOC114269869 n=1 Tax=Camellia sinensis TaxID=4442 RepID=UPI001036F31A|nr:uncharacterized protein LOC114269869 [Camellia sinensis]XP_028067033.1 uncharacterized protein LOC114269869 [Camellia sinensis]XP_028067034.1 uncharacterized protein LOC114269869 [Camellia sinensis]XP_028067035.1 uncharacterized protein LOC114269869 [Camellia sinensis]XP_028067036.1 uncharacterized protein LOC114269869 [Camellia sinensis]XP_028067037.1 uncharacterized protein LOC114269869 [Camellia sinensis]XP_028067038.1 uncharacterized protein LOC114269869 [Camellia sinensis]XP_02806703